jgi:hypothetical protein
METWAERRRQLQRLLAVSQVAWEFGHNARDAQFFTELLRVAQNFKQL